jgi:pimeloyl-ACP methyl ester carboxylesterase
MRFLTSIHESRTYSPQTFSKPSAKRLLQQNRHLAEVDACARACPLSGTAAWKSKPSWYVLANQDQTVHPDLQRFASKRMKADTTEVTSSHVPMLSHPDVVLDVIRKAASAVAAS